MAPEKGYAVHLDARAATLIADVCTASLEAHDDAIADAVGEIFAGLEQRLLEQREGVYPATLGLTPHAEAVLTATLRAIQRRADIGRHAVLRLLCATADAEAA